MIQRLFTSALPTAAVVAALVAGTAHAAPSDSTKAEVRAGRTAPADTTVRKGSLFSAVCFGDSAFGAEWSRLRADAQTRFPDLKLTNVEDLHITVVYIGRDWKPEDLDRIRAHALVVPVVPVHFTPEVVPLGHNNQVVVVELHGTPTVWADSVVAAKDVLNRLGLKRPEAYDTNFRTHITLAEARHSPPTPADSTALAGFRSWMAAKVGADPRKFEVTLGPATRVSLLLAGATRPAGAPEYIPVEEFLKQHPVPLPQK
jgi:2'-5' RNA ligase